MSDDSLRSEVERLKRDLEKALAIIEVLSEALEKVKKTAFYDQVVIDLCEFHLKRAAEIAVEGL